MVIVAQKTITQQLSSLDILEWLEVQGQLTIMTIGWAIQIGQFMKFEDNSKAFLSHGEATSAKVVYVL